MPVIYFTRGVQLPETVYLDTNLVLYARDVQSTRYRAASDCLGELIHQGSVLNLSPLVIDEFWWGLFRASHRALTGQHLTAHEFKRDKSIWRDSWPRIERLTREVLAW